MDNTNKVRERVLITSMDLFLKDGLIRVTMDDIAAACAVSKKTLYAHFSSKEDLLHEILLRLKHQLTSRVKQVLESDLPLFKKLKGVIGAVTDQSRRFSPAFLSDIQKTVPHFWEELQEYRQNGIIENVRDLVREGRDQGYIRTALSERFILHACFTLIDDIMKTETMIELSMSFQDLFEETLVLLFEGVLTESGRTALERELEAT